MRMIVHGVESKNVVYDTVFEKKYSRSRIRYIFQNKSLHRSEKNNIKFTEIMN